MDFKMIYILSYNSIFFRLIDQCLRNILYSSSVYFTLYICRIKKFFLILRCKDYTEQIFYRKDKDDLLKNSSLPLSHASMIKKYILEKL